MVAEAEVWVFTLSLIMIILSVSGKITQTIMQNDHEAFKYLHYMGIIGLLLLPLSFIIAMISGRAKEYVYTIFTTPLMVISGVATGVRYSDACTNGVCAIYCCENSLNSNIRWKDCDKKCNSVKGVFGENTGGICQHDATRETHCADTKTGGILKTTRNICNSIESIGPVDCTCCYNNDKGMWWDCVGNCSSHPQKSVGFPLSQQSCFDQKVSIKHCTF